MKEKVNPNPDAKVHPDDAGVAALFRRAVELKGITPPARGSWGSQSTRTAIVPTDEVAAISSAVGARWETVAYLLGLRSHSPIGRFGAVARANLAQAYSYVHDVEKAIRHAPRAKAKRATKAKRSKAKRGRR